MKPHKHIIIVTALLVNGLIINAQDIEVAKDHIENERFGSAEQLLEQNPGENPEGTNLLVKSYIQQDKMNEATQFVNTYLAGQASNPVDRIAYARYLFSADKKADALNILTSLLEEKATRKNASLLSMMAEVMIDAEKGEPRLALEWLETAQKRDKDNPSIDILKGMAYRKLGDASNAYTSYQNAIKKDPNNLKAHYLLGKIFRTQKNPEVYLPHFMKAYQADSTFAPVLEELYKHYYYKDVNLAKLYLEKYIANSDYSLQNDYDYTDVLYLTGDYAAAISAAQAILDKHPSSAQPRLNKLIAYSYAKAGDTLNALKHIRYYFSKEDPKKVIAADFELQGQLVGAMPGAEKEAASYFMIAAEMDTLTTNKVKFAEEAVALLKKAKDYSQQAIWLGKLYSWKTKTNNLDLFNWGIAHYMAEEYALTDSVFTKYTERYPEDIYGYYWKAQANAAIDTAMTEGLAIPHYIRVTEIGELDKEKHKKMLLTAYGYLGSYEANKTKDYQASLNWFKKYQEIDSTNATIGGYIEQLQKWVDKKE